jgi:hypothetical protein
VGRERTKHPFVEDGERGAVGSNADRTCIMERVGEDRGLHEENERVVWLWSTSLDDAELSPKSPIRDGVDGTDESDMVGSES